MQCSNEPKQPFVHTFYMYKYSAVLVFIAAISLSACGGGSGGGGGIYGGPIPTSSPSAGNVPLQETVAGSAAWVDSTSHRTLYFLDVDTATGGVCTGGCLNIWPVAAPSSGAQAQGNITIITRSDGTGSQWAYQGHPLYFFSGDSGPDQANGEGIAQAGGHWHVSRPSSSSNSGGGGCTGYYC